MYTFQKTDIALTAHVLITLSECLEILEGSARSVAIEATLSAVRFLESNIYSVTDPYQLAISSYALTLAKSSERELAMIRLQGLMRQGTGKPSLPLFSLEYPLLGFIV
jgi:hypothetical protein